MNLHDLPLIERPRERLQAHGAAVLSLTELLALILGRGVAGEPVMSTAQNLLAEFGSLEGVARASLEDLQQIKGLGPAKACQLKAWAELSDRLQRHLQDGSANNVLADSPVLEKSQKMGRTAVLSSGRIKVSDSAKVAELVRGRLWSYHQEHYVVISLDTRNGLIGVDAVSIGTLDAALVHPRETFEVAIRRHAAKVVLAHNHPSNDPQPSDDDLAITKRLVTAGKVLGIQVVDHVIVTKSGYYSLHDGGML